MIKISPVLVMRQRNREFYTLILKVADLLKYGRIERFGDDPNGVQRKLNAKHADKMLETLVDTPDTFFLESLTCDLQGSWRHDPATSSLLGGDDAYITIDDGSHRYEMCRQLALDDPELAEGWNFTVVCGLNSPYEERVGRFLQQEEGKAIDRRLTLAQRAWLGKLTEVEQEGWDLANKLNTDPRSPLFGLVIMEEQVTRPYSQRGDRTRGVNITGLMTSFKSILSQRSVLKLISRAHREIVIMTYFQMVKETWPHAWNSGEHMLCSSTGIQVVLELFTKSPTFQALLGEDFSQNNLRRALSMASSFSWSTKKNKHVTKTQLGQNLEDSLNRNRAKKGKAKVEDSQTMAA